MHNNYYFLRQLTRSLEQQLLGTVISDCFSQNKDELIIRFETRSGSFYIKANLGADISCLTFSNEFNRARKNSADLFLAMIGHHVTEIRQAENERSFVLNLTENKSLLFKMHGNRSNILLYENNEMIDRFRRSIDANDPPHLSHLDREIDWSFDAFLRHRENLSALYFTFGKIVWTYLDAARFDKLQDESKWRKIVATKELLESPSFFISRFTKKIILTLVPVGDIEKEFDNPVKAANEFFVRHTQSTALEREKSALAGALRQRIQANANYIVKNKAKLSEIETSNAYKVWADLVMANLHAIKPGTKAVTLSNFYQQNLAVEIKLKPELTPQKNAEIFYRKAKNQQIEIDKLKQSIASKETENQGLHVMLEQVNMSTDLKKVRELEMVFKPVRDEKQVQVLPYHEVIFQGFKIWVGKNAESNDVLTLKLSYKDDLWLHAKDVSGSHVLIKYQSGKAFPKDVIERAAELAAYNSKRRTDSLCPVVVTPKKFVRKRKGDPPGMVVVERENVIMVQPKLS